MLERFSRFMAGRSEKKRTVFFAFGTLLLLAGCGSDEPVAPQGQIQVDDDKEDEEKKPGEDASAERTAYDWKSLPPSVKMGDREPLTSYYSRQLTPRGQQTYTELYMAVEDGLSRADLSQPVTVPLLKKVMNILLLDTPELFYLEPHYEYAVNKEGNAVQVFFAYSSQGAALEKARGEFEKDLQQNLEEIRGESAETTEQEAEEAVIEMMEGADFESFTLSGNTKTPEAGRDEALVQSATAYDTAYGLTGGFNMSSVGLAKYQTYLLRQAGIDSAVAIGEFTTPSFLTENGYPAAEFPGAERIVQEQRKKNGRVGVRLNLNGVYGWSVVKLNEDWYHLDTVYPRLLINGFPEKDATGQTAQEKLKDYPVTINTNDYTISQSRIFYFCENILGVLPECRKQDFQPLYRDGSAFAIRSVSQTAPKTEEILEEMVEEKEEKRILQFCSEDVLDTFLNTFEDVLTSYNAERQRPIRSYRLAVNRQSLLVEIFDCIYSSEA